MNRCFVIGPIGDRHAPIGSERREVFESALAVFEDVIKPACAAHGLEPIRADQIAKSGEITEQIFRHLLEDEVVIADLSGANANVMYELGLRHTRNLLTITIGEYGLLPFDVSAIRTIPFSRSERGLIEARKSLQAALAVGLAEGSDPVTATRVWLSLEDEEALDADETRTNSDDDEVLDPDGFLEMMNGIEEGFPEMTETIGEVTDALNDLGAVGEKMGADVQALNAGQSSARQRLNVIGRWAADLQNPADRLTQSTSRFADQMNEIDPQMHGVLHYIDSNEQRDREDVISFLETMVGLASASREGMEGINELGGVVSSLGSVSKVLRRPGQQIGKAINTMARAVSLIDTWESQALKSLARLQDETEAIVSTDEDNDVLARSAADRGHVPETERSEAS